MSQTLSLAGRFRLAEQESLTVVDVVVQQLDQVAFVLHLLDDQVNPRLIQQRLEILTRVVKKLGRAVGTSLLWSESTAAGHVVSGSSDLLRAIEDGANS